MLQNAALKTLQNAEFEILWNTNTAKCSIRNVTVSRLRGRKVTKYSNTWHLYSGLSAKGTVVYVGYGKLEGTPSATEIGMKMCKQNSFASFVWLLHQYSWHTSISLFVLLFGQHLQNSSTFLLWTWTEQPHSFTLHQWRTETGRSSLWTPLTRWWHRGSVVHYSAVPRLSHQTACSSLSQQTARSSVGQQTARSSGGLMETPAKTPSCLKH